FVRDYKSLAKEADESIAKHKPLEYEIERLLRAVVNPKVGETNALSKPVTLNLTPSTRESKVVNNDRVIAPGMFRINPFKFLGRKRVDNTAKTRRPQPRSNTKNNRVPSASKSSCIENKFNTPKFTRSGTNNLGVKSKYNSRKK
ncbi:hypothetical protein Tco_0037611, partial [Tanacetum coccineum]